MGGITPKNEIKHYFASIFTVDLLSQMRFFFWIFVFHTNNIISAATLRSLSRSISVTAKQKLSYLKEKANHQDVYEGSNSKAKNEPASIFEDDRPFILRTLTKEGLRNAEYSYNNEAIFCQQAIKNLNVSRNTSFSELATEYSKSMNDIQSYYGVFRENRPDRIYPHERLMLPFLLLFDFTKLNYKMTKEFIQIMSVAFGKNPQAINFNDVLANIKRALFKYKNKDYGEKDEETEKEWLAVFDEFKKKVQESGNKELEKILYMF